MKIKKIDKNNLGKYDLDNIIDKVNEIIDSLNNASDEDLNNNLNDTKRCPNCGESYYMLEGGISTSVYYPPIIKDGVNINPDRNITTYQATCQKCGHVWLIKNN